MSRSADLKLGGSFKAADDPQQGDDDDRKHWAAHNAHGNKVAEADVLPNPDPSLNSRVDTLSDVPFTDIALQAVPSTAHSATGAALRSSFYLASAPAHLIAFDTPIKLDGQLSDHGNSETLSFRISSIDADAHLNHGTRNTDGSWSVSADGARDLHLIHSTSQQLHTAASTVLKRLANRAAYTVGVVPGSRAQRPTSAITASCLLRSTLAWVRYTVTTIGLPSGVQ